MKSDSRRGRPPELSTDAICQRRAELLTTLDYAWSTFAWHLLRAKTTKDIRRAFQPILERPGISPFVEKPHADNSMIELRKTRKRLAGYAGLLHKAAEDEVLAKERLERVEGALRDVGTDDRLELACQERRRDYTRASTTHADCQRVSLEIRKEIQAREAAVAQTALLDFIVDRRYTPTPISLAHALAGVPFVVWRRSMTLCIAACGDTPFSLSSQMFEDLKRALADPPREAAKAIEQVREYFLIRTKPASNSIRTLRSDWHYISGSIESIYSKKPPKDSLPYEVHAEYQRKTSSRSRYDQVRQEEDRL